MSHARVMVKRRRSLAADRHGGSGNEKTAPSLSSSLPNPSTVTRSSVQLNTLARLAAPYPRNRPTYSLNCLPFWLFFKAAS